MLANRETIQKSELEREVEDVRLLLSYHVTNSQIYKKPDRKECYSSAAFRGWHNKYARYVYPYKVSIKAAKTLN
jgi:hypothetical protein